MDFKDKSGKVIGDIVGVEYCGTYFNAIVRFINNKEGRKAAEKLKDKGFDSGASITVTGTNKVFKTLPHEPIHNPFFLFHDEIAEYDPVKFVNSKAYKNAKKILGSTPIIGPILIHKDRHDDSR